MPPNRRKYTPVRMPLERDLRRWRFSLPANDAELNNLTIENARGAIHGRIPRTRGYIKPSSVEIIENVRVKDDLLNPETHVEGPQLRPVREVPVTAVSDITFQNTLKNLARDKQKRLEYLARLPLRDQSPQNRRLDSVYPSGKGMIRGPVVTSSNLSKLFEERGLRRHFERFMKNLRENPGVLDEIRRGERFTYDKLWNKSRTPEDE